MLFQYNPLDYAIETNEQGELIITINRLALLSPRIRYNIHDAGGVIPFERMLHLLRQHGLDPLREVDRPGQPAFTLPFLYLFGRSDSTISYMGANIYPEDVEQALFSDADDARRLGAFCLELVDVGEAEQRPCVHVEILDGAGAGSDDGGERRDSAAGAMAGSDGGADGAVDDPGLADRLRERVLKRLLAANHDFRASLAEDSRAAEIQVRLHRAGQRPVRREPRADQAPLHRRVAPKPLPRARGRGANSLSLWERAGVRAVVDHRRSARLDAPRTSTPGFACRASTSIRPLAPGCPRSTATSRGCSIGAPTRSSGTATPRRSWRAARTAGRSGGSWPTSTTATTSATASGPPSSASSSARTTRRRPPR